MDVGLSADQPGLQKIVHIHHENAARACERTTLAVIGVEGVRCSVVGTHSKMSFVFR
jgi:hypothetical protein